ncbi:MAG TPA: hypothetical protein VGE36_13780 [Roseateles sp.]
MKLIDDARHVWHRLWSVRLALLGALFSAAEFAVSLAPESVAEIVGRGRFAAVAFVVGIGAAIARVVQQLRLTDEHTSTKAGE